MPVPKTAYEPPRGDGCATPLAFRVHGSLASEPVRGNLSLRAERVTLELTSITSNTKQTYAGSLGESICQSSSLDYSGKITTSAGSHPTLAFTFRLPWSLSPPTNSDPERTRLEIEGRDRADQEPPALELWDAPADPGGVLEPYEGALKSAVDVHAVVQAPDGSLLVAYSPAGSPFVSWPARGHRSDSRH